MKIKQISTQGFTLMEIMVVITIIGILAAIGFASLSEARARARFTQVETTFDQVSKAAEAYRFEKGYWPADTSPKPNGGVPEFVEKYLSFDSDGVTGGGKNLPPPPCEGYVYDWQNWPDYTIWESHGVSNRKYGEKIIKISLYDNSSPNRVEVATKCIYIEPGWKCNKDETGGVETASQITPTYCCNSPSECATKSTAPKPPSDCVDISTITSKTLYCN